MSKKKKSGRQKPDKSLVEDYDYHKPVFLDETIDFLITDPAGTYIDGTLGGGGHAALILSKIDSGGNLLAFDKDLNALEHCKNRFGEELKNPSPRLLLFNQCYSTADEIIKNHQGSFDGILLDLGVSSMQLDTDSRGLSYRTNSSLDMRFGDFGISAEELLNKIDEPELERILRDYGEEPMARRLARKIIERREKLALTTTFDLRYIVEESTPRSLHFKVLSRVFQAIRIAVNRELDVLDKALTSLLPLLNIGGRFVIISYHSLEDRIVKNFFKDNALPRKSYNSEETSAAPKLKILTPKPIVPNDEEQAVNPRSRSAKLRVAERAV